MKIPLANADALAAELDYELRPFCELIAVVGSVRRRMPMVTDIDLVMLPRYRHVPALRAHLNAITTRFKWRNNPPAVRLFKGVQVDVRLAAREGETRNKYQPLCNNFGSQMVLLTGSREHNRMLMQRAQGMGLWWNPRWGVFDSCGNCLASQMEEDIFKALELDFVPPHERDGRHALHFAL